MKSLWPFVGIKVQTYQVGRELAEKYKQSVYDTMIMPAALIAGCTTLLSEDLHNVLLIESRMSVVIPLT